LQGVLFTNLWIIVGVKYCFRYSQRSRRAQAQLDEEVDLATLRPFVGLHNPVQRRRREKKLLKIDDVNERFPVMTYKAWRAQRERAGLSAEGGIATQTADGDPITPTIPSQPATPPRSESPEATSSRPPTPVTSDPTVDTSADAVDPEKRPPPDPPSDDAEPTPFYDSTIPIASTSKHRDSTFTAETANEDEDDHPIPADLLPTTGDNCAICIELLEDEDEVRGLTCGHCYHQTCIDPWLTQRRASCPLCKHDYYIPKPIVEAPAQEGLTGNGSPIAQQGSGDLWVPFLRPFRPVMVPNLHSHAYGGSYGVGRIDRTRSTPQVTADADGNVTNNTPPQQSRLGGIMAHMPHVHIRNPFRRTQQNTNAPPTTNLSALERGEGAQ
jgi:hypothetical protein